MTSAGLARATLARQMLLERHDVTVPDAVERLVSLQAQLAGPPFHGLATRLERFQPGDLRGPLERGEIVRASLMRHTLHIVTSRDYLWLRPVIQASLSRALRSVTGSRLRDLDLGPLLAAARARMAGAPCPPAEMGRLAAEMHPDRDVSAMTYAIRSLVPMVQVPTGGAWGFGGQPAYALAEERLGTPLDPGPGVPHLVRRYLAAFGPATVAQVQAWSGLTGLKGLIAAMADELVHVRDDAGRDLVDLPGAPRPPDDAPAPPRLVPEYDNLLVGHWDRRLLDDAHRTRVFTGQARVRAVFLVRGRVAGVWALDRSVRGSARVVLEPFGRLRARDVTALGTEGERMLGMLEPGVAVDVRVAPPP
jgi:hypothetical protein